MVERYLAGPPHRSLNNSASPRLALVASTVGRVLTRNNIPALAATDPITGTPIDDHTRLAYVEALPNEQDLTCAGSLHRASAWPHGRGVIVARVLTDNAKAYRVGAQLARGLPRSRDPAPIHHTRLGATGPQGWVW